MLTREDLTDAQKQLIAHIRNTPKCAGWLGMGRGKTGATLTAFADAYYSLDARRMLVVAPLRVARDVWHAEVEQWAQLRGLTVSRIIGTSPAQRLKGLKVPADIHTINRENLQWLFSGYVQEITPSRFKQTRRWPWDWMVLDEAQSLKNPSSIRTLAASRISTFDLCDHIIELSGTPIPNGYDDLWAQMFILDHGQRLGATQDAYREKWFREPPPHGYRWIPKEGAVEEIQEALSDIVLAIPDAVPPSPVNPVYINLPDRYMKQYRQMERKWVTEVAGSTITAENAGVLGGKLLQMASGAMYVDDAGSYEIVHDEKIKALEDVLDSLIVSGPVLIGYGFKSDAERIGRCLDRICGKHERWGVLRSEESMADFREGRMDYGVIHPASGGHGLNDIYRAGCETLVWFGPTNNLELWLQLNARIDGGHRRGTNITMHVLVARDTKDEEYLQMLKDKNMDERGLIKALAERTR